MATELVEFLFERPGSESQTILSWLVDAVSDRDRALLDDLERLIREQRRSQGQSWGQFPAVAAAMLSRSVTNPPDTPPTGLSKRLFQEVRGFAKAPRRSRS